MVPKCGKVQIDGTRFDSASDVEHPPLHHRNGSCYIRCIVAGIAKSSTYESPWRYSRACILITDSTQASLSELGMNHVGSDAKVEMEFVAVHG